MLVLVGAVLIYPVIYSIAYKNNVLREIPVAVVDMDHSQMSRTMAKMADATQTLKVKTRCGSMKEAQNLFWDGKVNGIILLPRDFEKDIYLGNQTHIGVYCDASYFLMYKETLTGSLASSATLGAGLEIRRLMAAGNNMNEAIQARDPLPLKIHTLYNPSGAYGSYLMPGMILVILQQTLLIGIGLVGGAKVEKMQEGMLKINKTIQKGLVSAVIGRSMAYFLVSVFNMFFTLIILYNWFEFPDKGSLLNIFVVMIPFIFSSIFMGLSVSQLFRRREHSIMFLVFLSPLVLFLTGMSWPSEAIPKALYYVGHIFPSTLITPAYLRLRTMGVALADVRFEFLFLAGQLLFYFTLACITLKLKRKRFQKQMHQ